ncbi:MAG: transglycosylase SLT domain-containing protein [Anaerolineae bacterium]|nr:transglycosylase SLT domain-containing protein [Anaerolineae bacterium]
MEQITRTRVKKLLSGVAVALLTVQLVAMLLQGGGARNAGMGIPTFAANSNSNDSGVVAVNAAVCTATVRTQLLNQRSGPGEEYAVIGGAGAGEQFAVEGQDQTGRWLRVSTDSGSLWMSGRYLTLNGSCDGLAVYGVDSVRDSAVASGAEIADLAAASTPIPTAAAQQQIAVSGTTAEQVLAQAATTALSSVFTAEVLFWKTQIAVWSVTYQIDANLIATVMQIESCGNPSVGSSAGAQGLFQVMPFHFAQGEDMHDVETNARRGLEYLQGALRLAQNDVELALAGYNGGYGAIYGRWAAETQRYAYWGSGIYAEAISGAATSATLAQWLAAGGSSLCRSASQVQALMV